MGINCKITDELVVYIYTLYFITYYSSIENYVKMQNKKKLMYNENESNNCSKYCTTISDPIQKICFLTINKNMINDSYLNITLNNDTRKMISMKFIE